MISQDCTHLFVGCSINIQGSNLLLLTQPNTPSDIYCYVAFRVAVLQGKVSLVYSLPSEKYWSRRQDEFSQLFQEGYVLLQCKAVKGKCQSKYRNVEKQSNSQTQRQKHNICPLGIRITQTNRLPSDCLKTQRQTHKVYPLKVRAKGSEHS